MAAVARICHFSAGSIQWHCVLCGGQVRLFIRMSQLSYLETFESLLRFKIPDQLLFLKGTRKGISIYWSARCLSLYVPSPLVLTTALHHLRFIGS